jgi:hypothetical protein
MKTFKLYLLLTILIGGIFFSACKKEEVTYDVNAVKVLPPNAGKTKAKTEEEYVAVLYANLFQKALSSNRVVEISHCIASVGDKELAHEVIVSSFMNSTAVIVPSDSSMRANTDKFLEETYKKFLVRNITEAERAYFKNYIRAHPEVTPELIYISFALSNEYLYY